MKFLVTHAVPPEEGAVRGSFTPLHKLAFSGLLSILHALALRCASHRHFHEEVDLEPSTPSGGTELQRKKDQKRRLTIAAARRLKSAENRWKSLKFREI